MISNEHFKGSINSIILFLLDSNKELYGYEIVQLVKERTENQIEFTEGAIYPSLHKLENKKWIASRKAVINGRTRKYYAITEKGRIECQNQLSSLNSLFGALQAIFGNNLKIAK